MNAEKATEYLSRMNWKTFVEWLTANVILNRPEDPLQFTRDVVGAKLLSRGSTNYKPEDLTDWLRSCYTEATSLVDENGVIHGKVVPSAAQSLSEQVSELHKKIDGIQKLLDASRVMTTLDPMEAIQSIVSQSCRILNCDRATVLTVDTYTNELVLPIFDESYQDVRVPIGGGSIVGLVALNGETINISNAYSDPRFNSSNDKATGYKTSTILCMPIKNKNDIVIGVLQAINKLDDIFQHTDEEIMEVIATQSGITLENANLYKDTVVRKDKYRYLIDIISAMQNDSSVNGLMSNITQKTTQLIGADRCTLYLIDAVQKALYAIQGEVTIRISMDQGIAGSVASTGQILNIPDAYLNPNFNQAIDKKSGYRTKAILCLPIIANGDEIVGVLQLINKMNGAGVFTEDDEEIMMLYLSIAGAIIIDSKLYQQVQNKGKPTVTAQTANTRAINSLLRPDDSDDD